MSEIQLIGSVNYDVPCCNRSAYPKLRALLKRRAIMQTMSSYLIPWGMARDIEEGIARINTGSDGLLIPQTHQIRYKLFKYDEEVSGAELIRSAQEGLDRMLANAKNAVSKMVSELTFDTSESKDPVKTAKGSCRRFRQTLRDARALSLLFNLSNNLNAAFLAHEAWIMAKMNEINDWVDENYSVKIVDEGDGEEAGDAAEEAATALVVN
jgi:hypothetical protein